MNYFHVLFCCSFVFVTQLQKLRIFKIHFYLLCSFSIYKYVQEKNDFSCFNFLIIKISTHHHPRPRPRPRPRRRPRPLFLHWHSFLSSNCTSAFFLWKASVRQPMGTMALDGCTMLNSFWDGSSWYWLVGHWHGSLDGTLSEQAPVGSPVFALDGGHGRAAERKG